MTVTSRELAGRLGLPANDPTVARAVDAAIGWACDVFDVADEAELEALELRPYQVEAIAGYARDIRKLEKASFGYFAADGDVTAAVGNIGKRWRPQLIGERSFGFA